MNAFLILWSVVNVGQPNLLTEQIIMDNSAISFNHAFIITAIESSFRTELPITGIARGLMQVTPVALKEVQNRAIKMSITGTSLDEYEADFVNECLQTTGINVEELHIPGVSVRAGTCYFKLLMLDYEHNVYKAVTHYNGGSAAVRALEKHRPWPETKDYLGKFDRFSYYIGDR